MHSSRSMNTQNSAGTVYYMSPEQIQGKPRPATDQYALAVIVYEWLCGTRPFEGTSWEVIAQHLTTPPPPLREKVPNIPQEVEQVILKALAKDPISALPACWSSQKHRSRLARQNPYCLKDL